MLNEITQAIVDAIRNNQKDAVSDVMKIVAVLAGGISTFLFERWRKRGKIEITPIKMDDWRYDGSTFKSFETDYLHEALPEAVVFQFKCRVLNRYPDPKGLALVSVEFFDRGKLWWWRKKKVLHGIDISWNVVGEADPKNDIYLPPHSFTQLEIGGFARPISQEPEDLPSQLQDFRVVRIVCLVSPNRKTSLTYWFSTNELPNVDLGGFLQFYINNASSMLPIMEQSSSSPIEHRAKMIAHYKRVLAEFPKRLEKIRGAKG